MSVLNPDQLKLFMTGPEWQDTVTHSTDGPMPALWHEKTEQARQMGMTARMMARGYEHDLSNPPTIIFENAPDDRSVRRVQSEGHKRVAAAADIEHITGKPVYIPTHYVDNT